MARRIRRAVWLASAVVLWLVVGLPGDDGVAQTPLPGHPAEKRDMELVGDHDLQARSAYQPVIHSQGGRFIAYIGHHGGKRLNPLTGNIEDNGTSIVDVTDPRNPAYLHHIPGAPGEAEAGGASMARVCDGASLPRGVAGKTYLLRTLDHVAHEVWDVTDPRRPALVTTPVEGLKSTHKNWWEWPPPPAPRGAA
ncbi:MAG TPA: hypothetical protein VML54_17645 [Candidatus Limnocylindrales bacterium]|nr:hypothetical protein [Candidatus Limnocylindrales bacterium]